MLLALAPHLGIDLDELEVARRRVETYEAELDAAPGSLRRVELEELITKDIDELAEAYQVVLRALEQGGVA
jgi:hypothetical protein